MDERLHRELKAYTTKLIDELSSYTTESIIGWCATRFAFNKSGDESDFLLSPQKQIFFLLGLMLTTKEPEKPKEYTKNDWIKTIESLNQIFSVYAWMFWPNPEEEGSLTEEWKAVREVSMPSFLHYFNTGLLASAEQISTRIQNYTVPFNDILLDQINITATDALKIIKFISDSVQEGADRLSDVSKKEKNARISLLNRAQKEGWDLIKLRSEATKSGYLPYFESLMSSLQSLFKVNLNDLQSVFGNEQANIFWRLFSAKRGSFQDYFYMTERNIAEEKPLFQIKDDEAFFINSNILYNALLITCERSLIGSNQKESYYKRRDKVLIEESIPIFKKIFPEVTKYYTNIYESAELQDEHDLIIEWDDNIFIVEAKASPPIEPFRDPDKAFVRIKRRFRSDKGIQKAHEQAAKIPRKLRTGKIVYLYNETREFVKSLKPDEIKKIYCICLTRDDYGPIAIDLSLLLEKQIDDSYPWAVNILDLENFIDAWRYFGWGPEKLCHYLDDRVNLHGKVLTSDELEIAGFYISHGGLHWILNAKADRFFLNPNYSKVFDDIYKAMHGGEKVVYSPQEPYLTDMREALTEIINERDIGKDSPPKQRKIGRNEPCPCGSGKKYKKCCLK